MALQILDPLPRILNPRRQEINILEKGGVMGHPSNLAQLGSINRGPPGSNGSLNGLFLHLVLIQQPLGLQGLLHRIKDLGLLALEF